MNLENFVAAIGQLESEMTVANLADSPLRSRELSLAITNLQQSRLWLQESELQRVTREKDNAYAERNKCVALIARMAIALGLEAGLGRHDEGDKNWEDDWRNIVFIDLPSGQVSWHIHDSDLPMFEFLLAYKDSWDGHTTEEKYHRVLNPGL